MKMSASNTPIRPTDVIARCLGGVAYIREIIALFLRRISFIPILYFVCLL